MNQERHRKISDISGVLTDQQSALECLLDEEQEAYDILPETVQESAGGDDMIAAIDILDSASAGLQGVLDCLESIP